MTLPVPVPRPISEYVRESQLLLWLWTSIEQIAVFIDYEHFLRDGVILCQLIQSLAPQAIANMPKELSAGEDKKVKKDNIQRFLAACRAVGLPEEELFEVDDLLSLQNIPKVTKTIYALGQKLSDKAGVAPLGQPYDLWLEEQLAAVRSSSSSTSSANDRFASLPQGEDLYISHVDTNWLKEKLERRRAKDEATVVRPAREPLVQRTPSKPLHQLRTFFLEGPPPPPAPPEDETPGGKKKVKKLW